MTEPNRERELPLSTAILNWLHATGILFRSLFRGVSIDAVLLILTLAVYLSVRLIGLQRFPIYFFCDEAIQTVLAADFVRDGFRNHDHLFLPTYFLNDRVYNLCVSVYVQVVPYLAFGKSAVATRASVALVSLLAALSVGLILKLLFKTRHWHLGIALLSLAPAWFLHSRTAFETVVFASSYSLFLLFYLLYRYRSASYIYAAVISAALAFYSYSPGQFVVAVTCVLLFLSDLPCHWRNRKLGWRVGILIVLLALPYLRFRVQTSFLPQDHLRSLASYWMEPIPLSDKLGRYFTIYAQAISPGYWFVPNDVDLQRHVMKSYGHLPRWMFPFFLLGVLLAIRNVHSSAHRCLLIALLAAPAATALVGTGITRTLAFVIPATLLATLGIAQILNWIELGIAQAGKLGGGISHVASETGAFVASGLSMGILAALIFANFAMLRDALVNGPLWCRDYGLGQMQWGAFQIFDHAREFLREHPGTRLILSPAWANGTDTLARFFLGDPLPLELGTIDGHLFQRRPLDDGMVFVMTPQEYEGARTSGKFQQFAPERVVPYPDGTPGFYFARLRYVKDIDQVLSSERAARRQLDRAIVQFEGREVLVRHSRLDMGTAQAFFDGDWETVARTLEANPLVLELELPEPRRVSGLTLKMGSVQPRVTVFLYRTTRDDPVRCEAVMRGSVEQPTAVMRFAPVDAVRRLRIELFDPHSPEPAHVHLWEVRFMPG